MSSYNKSYVYYGSVTSYTKKRYVYSGFVSLSQENGTFTVVSDGFISLSQKKRYVYYGF